MQNIFDNRPMCERFHYDRLRNDRALGNNKNHKNYNIFVAIGGPFRGPKTCYDGFDNHADDDDDDDDDKPVRSLV